GWRIAVQLIRERFDNAGEICEKLGLCDEKTFKLQSVMADKGLNAVKSTSMGRVFDAVSAILGIRKESTFEGEASTALMYEAEIYERIHSDIECKLTSHVSEDGIIDTTALAGEIAERFLRGEDRGKLSYLFHKALMQDICTACERLRERYALDTAALSGGVFQNRLLTRLTKSSLEAKGFKVLIHSLIPPNDGGIALGQAAYKWRDHTN
ncbi:MAG: carbamoyltransferase HypF, partial [Ruminococcus sp.]|nr:carbamoyltransferase HypF [Ruminococcus sp.]